MLPDRSQLDALRSDRLRGAEVDIAWKRERRAYVLQQPLGPGATSVAWRATDAMGRSFAIKFVLQDEYATHSLDTEALRANSLESRLFAKIDFFGEPTFAKDEELGTPFYAIVVEWIPGVSLREYADDPRREVSPTLYRRLARDLCEVLQALKSKGLSHNDLHDRNILVRPERDVLANEETVRLVVIDSGQLKTEERRRIAREVAGAIGHARVCHQWRTWCHCRCHRGASRTVGILFGVLWKNRSGMDCLSPLHTIQLHAAVSPNSRSGCEALHSRFAGPSTNNGGR